MIKVETHPDGSICVEIQANSPFTAPPAHSTLIGKDLWEVTRLILNDLETLVEQGSPTWPCGVCNHGARCIWCQIGMRVQAMKTIRGPRI